MSLGYSIRRMDFFRQRIHVSAYTHTHTQGIYIYTGSGDGGWASSLIIIFAAGWRFCSKTSLREPCVFLSHTAHTHTRIRLVESYIRIIRERLPCAAAAGVQEENAKTFIGCMNFTLDVRLSTPLSARVWPIKHDKSLTLSNSRPLFSIEVFFLFFLRARLFNLRKQDRNIEKRACCSVLSCSSSL